LKAFVLDCSVTMAWCFDDEANEQSDQALVLLKNGKAVVPAIWPLEVLNVLHVSERKKRISVSQSNTFISLLNALPIEIDMSLHDSLNKTILEISRQYSISAYDAAYLELAKRRTIPLFSFDKILIETAKKFDVEINPL